ncbi:hypothetical protein V502_01175 [Pseudogymnoascus sp. VKM F-4520 (FW-2644)]|nr:hypothetical protein V502_01175 [Pseudogymnoascus sp. VKM F-4520 (FW-2644)]
MNFSVLGAVAMLVSVVYAQTSQYCPSSGVCLTVNIPAAGSSNMFFQITGPSTMSYIAFGQGSKMSGSNMFIIYANSAGNNVTLSPRTTSGHSAPSASTSAALTLLAGSGITGGVMTANVLCTNCQSWSGGTMDFTSTKSSWIYGTKSGSALNTNSVSVSISQHDNYGSFSLNLATATGGNSANPFLTSSSVTTNSASSATSAAASKKAGSDDSNSSSSSSGGSSSDTSESRRETIVKAHGLMGAAAFVLAFPAGAIVLRVFNFKGLVWIHVAIQMLAYATSVAVLGLGLWLALAGEELMMAHPIIGIVVIGSLFFQPVLGLCHHIFYKRRRSPNAFTSPHIWWGRLFITLGIINGGLGLELTGDSTKIEIAYAAVAAIIWIVWMAVAFMAWRRKSHVQRASETGWPVERLESASEEMINIVRPKNTARAMPAREVSERIRTDGRVEVRK